MAFTDNELAAQGPDIGPRLRFDAKSIEVKTLANAAGGPTLPVGTPLAFNTSTNKWVVWTNGGANGTGTISGFLWPDDITLDATDDVLAPVMLMGRVSHDDVPVPSGETQNNLTAALKAASLREKGIIVTGVDGVA